MQGCEEGAKIISQSPAGRKTRGVGVGEQKCLRVSRRCCIHFLLFCHTPSATPVYCAAYLLSGILLCACVEPLCLCGVVMLVWSGCACVCVWSNCASVEPLCLCVAAVRVCSRLCLWVCSDCVCVYASAALVCSRCPCVYWLCLCAATVLECSVRACVSCVYIRVCVF